MVADLPLAALSPVLIANRGEIAVRVARTVRERGLRSVAVFSAADRGATHTRAADLAAEVESYLSIEALLEAAARARARSVHPGYGFLSENARFAEAVREAGLVWIGPPPPAIELMGDKGRSKELAREAGVPVVPGTPGTDADADAVRKLADEHGYPLVIKALAGGGGKGMRVVRSGEELAGALAGARREAEAAFGDGRVLAERYLERPRHIEVQILADGHGNFVHLGERECSLQRRHQKVIEEAPSPVADERLRERMGSAAIDLAAACDYVGAGTVEFITPADPARDGDFFFLEMNTRLQVEHPVTELVWGVDLVAEQLEVAAGRRLRLRQEQLAPAGHAVEARLYAEDPGAGFLPATGTIERWREPRLEGLRIDAGVERGSVVGTEFDPMLAKVIAHGPDRETAVGRLDRGLAELELLGVPTNAAFSRALLARDDVASGELDTGLLERVLEGDRAEIAPPEDLGLAAAAGVYLRDVAGQGIAPGPWRRRFADAGEVRIEGGRLRGELADVELRAADLGDGRIEVQLDGLARRYFTAWEGNGDGLWIGRDGHQLLLRIERRGLADAAVGGSLEAPMPGKVLAIEVASGDRVREGELLMVLESMKMELQITAPSDGEVGELSLAVGDQVGQGDPLLTVVTDDQKDGA